MSETTLNETADNPTHTGSAVWPCLLFRDAPAMMNFLIEAFGFEKVVAYFREDDPSIIEHGQLRWPLGGDIMFGTAGKNAAPTCNRPTGTSSIYLACDDPDSMYARAKAAGAAVAIELTDEDYGSRGFTVSDPEGNLWSFGTYRGA